MSTSLHRRLRAVEKKTYREDEVPFNTTVGEVKRLIDSLQGTCLKPVPFEVWSV